MESSWIIHQFSSVQLLSRVQLCDLMNHSIPGLPVHHQLPPSVHPNPCPSNPCSHPTISSSVVPFSSCPQSCPASGSFLNRSKQGWEGPGLGERGWWHRRSEDVLWGAVCSQEGLPAAQAEGGQSSGPWNRRKA